MCKKNLIIIFKINTMSIVKNAPEEPGVVQKVYYNENVYRDYREIMQVGLECLGNVDDYCIWEVLLLAAKSLQVVSAEGIYKKVKEFLEEDKYAVWQAVKEEEEN